MLQNLRVDVIYHQTASDFEMEFNLNGCCRMRLLSDKTTDKKAFVKALARGVSRSRIIIACGPLFSADGLINTVATAIGSGLCQCDSKTYGIRGNDTIHIIVGSTPLVTPDGYFGGCIIESGSQTIILLTENRAFRKVIMKSLIHPYIEEISYLPENPRQAAEAAPTVSESAALSEGEVYLTETDAEYDQTPIADTAYEAPAATDDPHNIQFIMDGDTPEAEESEPEAAVSEAEAGVEFVLNTQDENNADETEQDNAIPISQLESLYTEVEPVDDIKERYAKAYVPSAEDNMFITTPDFDEPPKAPRSSGKSINITIVILVLILLLAVLTLVYFVFLKPMTMGVGTSDYIKQIFSASSSANTYL